MNAVAGAPAAEAEEAAQPVVSEAEVDEFQRNGAVCLRALFARHWLDKLAAGVDKNFAAPGPYHTRYTPRGGPGGFYDDYCNWQRIGEYRDFALHSPAAEIAARLMRSRTARFYHEHVLVKEPGTAERTPWHHDQPYYGVDGEQLCSIWLPLDPVPKRACPEYVAGSHAGGALYYPRLFASHQDYSAGEHGFESVPDIDRRREQYEILSWDLEPGDCIVFHMRTVHGAPSTATLKTRRRGFASRWLGDDARFARRPWATSPPFPHLRLTPGGPMEHPAFPVVWRG
ncbi:MAG: phytanoyl-CoA dioxygenase family protein [Gammaproteobacteria bacterium]|nr:phytanoyl-CoA dioxygenase family protein [Gammaproteobacteria bacterium]